MKQIFLKFYAPKATGGGAPLSVAKNDEQNKNVENLNNEQAAVVQPAKTAPAPVVNLTPQEKLDAANLAFTAAIDAVKAASLSGNIDDIVAGGEKVAAAKLAIKNATAELDTEAQRQKVIEMRNERAAMVDGLIAAVLAGTDYAKLSQDIKDELMAKYPLNTPATSRTTGIRAASTNGSKQSDEIVAKYQAYRAAGQDHTTALKNLTDVDKYPRGSAWGPVNTYRIGIGEVVKK